MILVLIVVFCFDVSCLRFGFRFYCGSAVTWLLFVRWGCWVYMSLVCDCGCFGLEFFAYVLCGYCCAVLV